ncbi:MAG: hypothetical protein IJV70_01710 [Clostridia bacterium]|nr:hypothetical protein [Clostridia bacterium]
MKKLLLILLAALFIFSGCEAPPEQEITDIYDLEIGQFPGDKYTTCYTAPENLSYFPRSEFDPLYNILNAQNYFLNYSNQENPICEFTFNGVDYTGKLGGMRELNVTAPYVMIPQIYSPITRDFFGAEIWLHSGEVKALYYDEIHKAETEKTEEELKQIVNAKASEYIDISKYEIEFNFAKGRAKYHQKFGDLYLSDPFTIDFCKDGYITHIFFNKTGIYDTLEFDLTEVEKGIHSCFDKANNQMAGQFEITNIEFKNVDICKYDVAVVVSEVNVQHRGTHEDYTFTFFTKISD